MSQTVTIAVLLILALTCAATADVVPTKIRFYTGNLSVGHFMEYWGTGTAASSRVVDREFCDQMKSVGVSAVCDYIGWCVAEKEPGKWDWSVYDRNEQALHANGLQYNVFCWLHFPPKWFMETSDYVPYRCEEHDKRVEQMSIWAPGTLKVYERFYRELAAHFGDKIDFIRLATPAEYGEIGYPNGMTNWLVKQEHVHPGYWCGDIHARADFRAKLKKRYKDISALNKAWGTSFESFDAVEYPAMAKARENLKDPMQMTPGERRRILDFVGWYYDSQAEFVRKAVGIVRTYFPHKEIILSMGYGSQNPVYGNDDVGIARLCKELKVVCQTPGNIPYFAIKSLASPCHFYGVPYFTEPPGDMDRKAEVNRIFSDASCGAQTYFDYPQNLLGAKDIFEKYGKYLDGSRAIVDVAVFFPTTEHRLRNEDWPRKTLKVANELRRSLDYDLVDERMVRDGALKEYKALVMCEGRIMEKSALEILGKWIKDGGTVIRIGLEGVETVEGDKSLWQDLIRRSSNQVIGVAGTDGIVASLRTVGVSLLIEAPVPNVTVTLFRDRILNFNSGDKPVDVRYGDQTLHLEPHSIGDIPLK